MGKDSTWGFPGYLSDEEKAMLADLRKRVDAELPKKDYLARDATLLRFCRARNFHLAKAWDMLKEDVEWREQFEGYIYIRSRDFGGAYAMHEEEAVKLGGKSKDGRPVLLVNASHYWPKLITDNIQIVYFFTFYVDAVCRMAEAAGHETFFAVCDLAGFSMANFSFSQIKIAISLLQNHYPERLGMIYVVNAPFVFTAAWRMIQPLLDERTRNKIDILGSDVSKMYENIDASQLEPPFGTHAKFTIPDPIVQIAIDNEKYLQVAEEPTEITSEVALPAGEAAVPLAVPLLAPTKKSRSLRKGVRKMLRRMLFTTEKRAAAASIGLDPDKLDDSPKKLTSGLLSKKTSLGPMHRSLVDDEDAGDTLLDGEVEDTEKDMQELREAHDKMLNKLRSVEVVAARRERALQNQIYAMLVILLSLVVWALRREGIPALA